MIEYCIDVERQWIPNFLTEFKHIVATHMRRQNENLIVKT